MAEGLIKAMLSEPMQTRVSVASAGTHAIHGNQASDFAVQVMQTYGIDIAGHRARILSKTMLKQADLVLVMEKSHLNYLRFMSFLSMKKVHRISEFDKNSEPYDLPDPIGGDMDQYRASAILLKTCLKGVYAYLEEILQI
jgi:protein-tyrosine-phosphatase